MPSSTSSRLAVCAALAPGLLVSGVLLGGMLMSGCYLSHGASDADGMDAAEPLPDSGLDAPRFDGDVRFDTPTFDVPDGSDTGIEVQLASRWTRPLSTSGKRCCTSTTATGRSLGSAGRIVWNAVNPPSDAPIATTSV